MSQVGTRSCFALGSANDNVITYEERSELSEDRRGLVGSEMFE